MKFLTFGTSLHKMKHPKVTFSTVIFNDIVIEILKRTVLMFVEQKEQHYPHYFFCILTHFYNCAWLHYALLSQLLYRVIEYGTYKFILSPQSLAYKNVQVLASEHVSLQTIVLRQNICKAPNKDTGSTLDTLQIFADRLICSIHCLPNFEKIISNFYTNFQAKCGNNNNTQQQLTINILARAFFSTCYIALYRGRTLNRVILVGQPAKLYCHRKASVSIF